MDTNTDRALEGADYVTDSNNIAILTIRLCSLYRCNNYIRQGSGENCTAEDIELRGDSLLGLDRLFSEARGGKARSVMEVDPRIMSTWGGCKLSVETGEPAAVMFCCSCNRTPILSPDSVISFHEVFHRFVR
ncbi:hypothetical protein RRG08_065278 [Elysia crispata]|uniref:Uncharacterized protein n=1 Tax=Elysia crispata TaxID=231223 RepID=A0AAE1APL0_9GAST|nr:hypothetical protein RRG08_065278 [Elysia crispata]